MAINRNGGWCHCKASSRLATLIVGSVPALCVGQEQPIPVTSVSESDSSELTGPQNLPGHPKRDQVAPETPKPPREWFGERSWLEWSRLTGDWGGARTKLEDAGLSFSASYVFDWSSVLSGGVSKRASTRTLFDLNATLDLEKAIKLPGGTVYADFYASDGRGASEDSGDFSGTSNIATGDNTAQLSELWYQQFLFDKKLKFKVGKIDANFDFAYFTCTPDFISSPAASPATLNAVLPTFPNPATGIDVFFNPTEQFYVGAGFFDGTVVQGNQTGRLGPASFFRGDGYLLIGEAGASWKGSLGGGRASVGVWYDTADIADFDGNQQSGTGGFYLMGEQRLLPRDGAPDDAKKGLFVFAEYGYADQKVNPAAQHLGGGLSWLGTFPGRDFDSAGAVANWIDLSNSSGSPFIGDELSFDLYYKFQATPAISITPDLQWIVNPSGNPAIADAVVAGIRMNFTF